MTRDTDQLAANGWNYFTLPANMPVGKSVFVGYEWTAAVKDTFGLASQPYYSDKICFVS